MYFLVLLRIIFYFYLKNIFLYSDQAEARRNKVKEARKRREERKAVKQAELISAAQKD